MTDSNGEPVKPRHFQIEKRSIASHELTPDILDRRKKNECENEGRWLRPSSWLPEADPDIDRVFIDAADRERLGLSQMYPVKARRDIADLFLSQVLGVGIFFFVSALSIGGLLPSTIESRLLISLVVSGLLGASLMILLIRSRIK